MLRTRSALLLVALVALSLPFPVRADGPKHMTVVFVRHAEKASEPKGNPPLTDAGRARAEALARVVGPMGLTAIITSPFDRTRQTAVPIASRTGIEPATVAVEVDQATSRPTPASTKALVKEITTRGGTVLVVGHSNTIPDAIAELGGPNVTIDDNTFDDLFILTLVDGKYAGLAHLKYGP